MIINKPFLFLDTEYTSWEGSFERDWSDPGEFKEIVQFAAFSYSKNNESKLFDFYIKPKLNPELSSYFKKLTGISQEVVNNSRSNLRTIVDFLSKLQHSHTIVSWGPDLDILILDLNLKGIKHGIKKFEYLDFRDFLSINGISPNGLNSGNCARKIIGENFTKYLYKDVSLIVEINPHNANFDVMSMFSVFIYLNEKLNEVKFPNYRKSI